MNFLKFRYDGWRGKKGFQSFKIRVLLFACNIFLETFFGEENVRRVRLSVNFWGKIAKQVDKFIGEVNILTSWG